MNSIVLALANRAVKEVCSERMVKGQVERTWHPDAFNEKYAELIIKECIDLLMKPEHVMTCADELSPFNEGWVRGRLLGVEHIKEHFGLE